MKTSEAQAQGNKCPQCGAPTTIDRKGRGFVRHKFYEAKCRRATYGRGGKD